MTFKQVFYVNQGNIYDIIFFAQKSKNKFAIKLNRKLKNQIQIPPPIFFYQKQQFKALLHSMFLCLNHFSSLTHLLYG